MELRFALDDDVLRARVETFGARLTLPRGPARDERWLRVADGLTGLAMLALARVGLGLIAGVMVLGVAASRRHASGETIIVLLAVASGVVALLTVVNVMRVARAPDRAGASAGRAAWGMGLAALVEAYAASLNVGLLRAMHDEEAYEPAKALPYATLAAVALGAASAFALFSALGNIARAIGEFELALQATRGRWFLVAAAALGVSAMAIAWTSAPTLALLPAAPALVAGVLALVWFVRVALRLGARLRADDRARVTTPVRAE